MKIKWQRPKDNIIGRLATDYYLDNEKTNGSSIFRNISLRKCAQGDIGSPTLSMMDSNYAQTMDQISMIRNGYMCDFVGLYADNDHLIAHTMVVSNVAVDDKIIAHIGEIHIDNRDNYSSEGINFVLGIYRQVITFIEEVILDNYPDVERIDLISLAEDGNFWEITSLLGYDIDTSCDLPGRKIRFSKYIKERNMSYERRITNKQESK